MASVACNPIGKTPVRALSGYGSRVAETAHPPDVLRRFLTEQGWTQGELAQALHVDPKTVSRWMTGGITPSWRRLDEG